MTPTDILVQFVTIFLGAFLAFWLENVRERQQLRKWVETYLNRQAESLKGSINSYDEQDKVFIERLNSLNTLLKPDLEPSQEQWTALLSASYPHSESMSFLIQGEALQVLPSDLAGAIANQNEASQRVTLVMQITYQFYNERILAFALREPSRLDEPERAILYYYTIVIKQTLKLQRAAKQADEALLRTLEAHGYYG